MANHASFSRSTWLATGARAAVTSLIMTTGVVGLALLADSQRITSGQLELLNFSRYYLEQVAGTSFLVLGIGFFFAEKIGDWFLRRGMTWRSSLVLVSFVFAILVGLFVHWLVFESPPRSTPFRIMLLTGGGWVGYAGIGLQFALWQLAAAPDEELSDFPRLWYAGLVMILAFFFGGLHASTSIDRQFWQVVRYRREHWVDQPHEPLEPGKGILDEAPYQ